MIETVGVGQAETEIADVADTVAVVVQPGSGDVLQFLKSGIMEIPDVLVVTKADLGQIAMRTRARPERRAALARLELHARARGLLAAAARAGSRSWSRRSTSIAPGSTSPRDACGARRAGALTDFARRARRARAARARRPPGGRATLLAEQEPDLEVPALVAVLERARMTREQDRDGDATARGSE